MQEPQRLLSRLNTVSLDWHHRSAITGQLLTAQDIAAAMAGLPPGIYALLRFLWCQDCTVLPQLNSCLLFEVTQIAREARWSCKNKPTRLQSLIHAALYDMHYASLCKPCNGTGIRQNQPCIACNQTGHRKRQQAEYARLCKVNPSNWQRSWASKFNTVYNLIVEWNDVGMSHVLKRL